MKDRNNRIRVKANENTSTLSVFKYLWEKQIEFGIEYDIDSKYAGNFTQRINIYVPFGLYVCDIDELDKDSKTHLIRVFCEGGEVFDFPNGHEWLKSCDGNGKDYTMKYTDNFKTIHIFFNTDDIKELE